MRITAGNCHTWLGKPLLRANDMHDSLFSRIYIKKSYARFLAILAQLLDHSVSQSVRVWFICFVSWYDVINRGECSFRKANRKSFFLKHTKSLWACYLMYEMSPNEKLGLSILKSSNSVGIPNFLKKIFLRHIIYILKLPYLQQE